MSEEEIKIIHNLNDAKSSVVIDQLNQLLSSEHISINLYPTLIELLDHQWDEFKRGSAYGPTYINPDTDLPIANLALNVLSKCDKKLIPLLLNEVKEYLHSPRHYFIIRLLGHFKSKEAISILEKHFLENTNINYRVNFDQFDDYPVGDICIPTLLKIDKELGNEFLNSLINLSNPLLNSYSEFQQKRIIERAEEWLKEL